MLLTDNVMLSIFFIFTPGLLNFSYNTIIVHYRDSIGVGTTRSKGGLKVSMKQIHLLNNSQGIDIINLNPNNAFKHCL